MLYEIVTVMEDGCVVENVFGQPQIVPTVY